ncbi:MAG: ABC transporter transmembrane domain-containing protein [Elsteraceae bacterium]
MGMRKPAFADQFTGAERPRSRNLGVLRRLFAYVLPYKRSVALASIALVIAASTVLALGGGLRYLVDKGFVVGDGGLLDQAVLILFGVVILLAGSTYARYYLVSFIGERVVADIRRDVFAHTLLLDPGFYDSQRTSEISSRLTSDVALVQVVVGTSVSIALRNSLLFAGGTALLIATSPKLTLLVFLVVPLVLVPILTYGRRVRRLSRLSQDRIADLSVQIDESLSAIRTVQAFTREDADAKRFAGQVESAFSVAMERVSARALLTACVIFLVFGAISVILWIGGHDVLGGRISPGELSAFVFYAAVVAGAAGAISEVMGDLQRAAGATERLFELMDTQSAILAPANPKLLPNPAQGAVEMRAVNFRYPTRTDRLALEGLTFSIKPGERVALVGPSGAGKSTVFQLLLRYYDPEAGSVLLDGLDLREVDPKAARARIGVVSQDAVVFAASVEDNIRYGRPDASDADVRAAGAAAFATEFIDKLPEGWKTQVGERGVRLSGGQRQRIAIARAILRDPALLLLDEATSALDAESERAVQNALDRLMIGRSSLVIAHRLATVRSADRILVMDNGKIVAEGKHEELVAAGGLYARLAALQFREG